MHKQKSNMYSDSVKQWNVFVGCHFDCVYCRKSFQAQMKRQKPKYDEDGNLTRGCQMCYDYYPHFHEERLSNDWVKANFPKKTIGDEFIWCCSSSDIYFAKKGWIDKIIDKIRELEQYTFFFQSKAPEVFFNYDFPDNVLLGITLETNRIYSVSKAPLPRERAETFAKHPHKRKIVTVEPIMAFDLGSMVQMIKSILPIRVYVGYDTKKCGLIEPYYVEQTYALIRQLSKFTKVKLKYMKEIEVKL